MCAERSAEAARTRRFQVALAMLLAFEAVGHEPTSIVLTESPSGALVSLGGFPAVSADGMHVAVMRGDPATGPLLLRIARIDGSVLLEQEILGAGDGAPPDAEREHAKRRLRGPIAAAGKVLARAGMTALTPAREALRVVGDEIEVALDGFLPERHAMTLLDRVVPGCPDGTRRCTLPPCRMPHRIVGVFADHEHGLVVAQLAHTPTDACPAREARFIADEWHVFALAPAQ